jgi:hypothetical protein
MKIYKMTIKGIIIAWLISLTAAYGVPIQDNSILDLPGDECYKCHMEIELLPEDFSQFDIHLQSGLSCSGCHGGDHTKTDEEDAMNTLKGFVGIPTPRDMPNFCGKCHAKIEIMRTYQPRIATDQVDQYATSVHGKKLSEGDSNVATCVSCHTAHSILPAKDTRSTVYAINIPVTCNKCHGNGELMSQYNLKSNQYDEYSKSVHGIALLEDKDTGAPACNDCHGNHGATPPGIQSLSHVCGTCHINNMNYFNKSAMAEPFTVMGYHACEQCHGNHSVAKTSDKMIGSGQESKCSECHDDGDAGDQTAQVIFAHLTGLAASYDSAKTKSVEVRIKGMNDVEIEYLLKDAKQSLIQSRTLIHTFDTTQVIAKTTEGMKATTGALKLADNELDEYSRRRYGFGIATILLVVFAIGLYLKIRTLKKA